jgi:hypothetical protein
MKSAVFGERRGTGTSRALPHASVGRRVASVQISPKENSMREGGAVMPSMISVRVICCGLKVLLDRERANVPSFGMSMALASTSANSWDCSIPVEETGLDPRQHVLGDREVQTPPRLLKEHGTGGQEFRFQRAKQEHACACKFLDVEVLVISKNSQEAASKGG